MRLEELTIENVKELDAKILKNLQSRAEQLFNSTTSWKLHINKNQMGLNDPIEEGVFLNKCAILYTELHKRKLIDERSSLDTKLIKKAVKGIDTQDLPILTVKKGVAHIVGDFVNNPVRSSTVNMIIDEDFPPEIHKRIKEIVQKETNKVVVLDNSYGTNAIPLYDLVLLPQIGTKTVEVSTIKKNNDNDGICLNFIKADKSNKKEEKDVAFTKNEEQRIVGGIVWELGSPDKTDAEGDFIDDPADIWKCLKSFALNGHEIHFMHKNEKRNVTVLESFMAEEDTIKGGEIIPANAWYVTAYVEDDDLWEACKDGSLTGFSMSGRATAITLEE